MHRLLATTSLVLAALALLASSALGATSKPKVTSFSPAEVPVNSLLTIKGRNFVKGARHDTVYFTNATTGKTVRARPRTATTTKITVVVPSAITKFMSVDATSGQLTQTRFLLSVYGKTLGSKTPAKNSPLILPPGGTTTPGTPTPGGTGGGPNPAPEADCDGDGTPNSTDNDDDNDGLSDDTEKAIGTDPCKPDTDGDGVGDAYEYYASLDLNANPNYAGKRPYPNPLDGSDANKDFDGDGLTMTEEYNASLKFGTATSAPLTYSDGNQQSVAPANSGAMDLDENGRITDEEKDADNDGLPNWIELAKTEPNAPSGGCSYVNSSNGSGFGGYSNIFTNCGSGAMPNGNTFTGPAGGKLVTGGPVPAWDPNPLNWLDPDSDGDGLTDAADDQDFDGVSNIEEIQPRGDGLLSSPQDPCDPNPDSPACPTHGSH